MFSTNDERDGHARRRDGASGRRGPGLGDLILGVIDNLDPTVKSVLTTAACTGLLATMLGHLTRANPALSVGQRELLRGMISGALEDVTHWRIARALERLRSVVSLAAPHERAKEVWEMWIGLLQAAGVAIAGWRALDEDRRSRVVGAGPAPPRDPHVSSTSDLGGDFGIDEKTFKEWKKRLKKFKVPKARIKEIPPVVFPAMLRACEAEEPPVCSITLEELVNTKKHLVKGVAALAQPAHEIDPTDEVALRDPDNWHVFLFKQEALKDWFDASPYPINPLTRNPVTRAQVFPLTSSDDIF